MIEKQEAGTCEVLEDTRKTDISKGMVILNKVGIYAMVALLIIVGVVISPSSFLSAENIRSILQAVSLIGISCVGLAFVVYSSNFNDMSIPMTIAISGILAVQFIPYGLPISLLVGVGGGTLVGVANGLMIGKFRSNPIIWTLAFNLVLSGVVRVALGGTQIYPDVIAGDNIAAQRSAEQFTSLARTYFFNGKVPLMVVVMVVLFILAHFLLTRTPFGNKLKMVGSNYEAARLSGVDVVKTIILAYVVCSFCAAITGIFYASLTKIGVYSNGEGYDFECLTAVLLGGMTLNGGKGHIVGVFGGVLVVGMLNNIMTLIDIPTFNQWLVQGLVFLFIVWLNTSSERKLGRV